MNPANCDPRFLWEEARWRGVELSYREWIQIPLPTRRQIVATLAPVECPPEILELRLKLRYSPEIEPSAAPTKAPRKASAWLPAPVQAAACRLLWPIRRLGCSLRAALLTWRTYPPSPLGALRNPASSGNRPDTACGTSRRTKEKARSKSPWNSTTADVSAATTKGTK